MCDSSIASDRPGRHSDRLDESAPDGLDAPNRLPGGVAPVVLEDILVAKVGAVDDGEGVPHWGDPAEPVYRSFRKRLPLTANY